MSTRSRDPGPEPARPPAAAPLGPAAALLVDAPRTTVHARADLAGAVLSLAGAALVLLLGALAPGTADALTVGVRSATGDLWQTIVDAPFAAVEGLATFVLPLAVVVQQGVRLGPRAAARALGTGVAGALAGLAAGWLIVGVLPASPAPELRVVLNPFVAGMTGMLTLASSRHRSRLLRTCWWVLVAVLLLTLLRGQATLTATAVMWLVGRAAGQLACFATGAGLAPSVHADLVTAVRTAGIDARSLVRTDLAGSPDARAWLVSSPTPPGYTVRVRERPRPAPLDEDADAPDPVRVAPTTHLRPPPAGLTPAPHVDAAAEVRRAAAAVPGGSTAASRRHYLVTDADGAVHEVDVLDAADHETTLLQEAWRRLVRPGVARNPSHSLDDAAERLALVMLAARQAGVRAPAVHGLALTPSSAVVVTEHVPGARPLAALTAEEVTDELLDALWREVRRAHHAGIAHLALSARTVLVDRDGAVWIRDWHEGEVASTEVSRRIDLAQTLTLQARLVGVDRAVASAQRVLDPGTLTATAPLLQTPALPATTRAALDSPAAFLRELREAVVATLPEADLEPVQLTRFSWRSVLAAVVLVAILWALVTSLDGAAVLDALTGADPWWIVAAFLAGLTTYAGGGLTLAAFSPGRRITPGTATRVHLAAKVVGMAAPAGIGPAAVNLRYLVRRGLSVPVSVATVALVQLTQFAVTVLGLVLLAAVTGTVGTFGVPGAGTLWALAAAGIAMAVVAAIPPLRRWLWQRVRPTLERAWGRVTWLAAHPGRLALGVLGSVVLTAGFVVAFGFALAAFGHSLPVTQLALTYLVSSTLGSLVPTPGGIGPVEAALTGGLTLAGVPASVAVSAAVIFRLVTFWLPVPLGWVALRRLQHQGIL